MKKWLIFIPPSEYYSFNFWHFPWFFLNWTGFGAPHGSHHACFLFHKRFQNQKQDCRSYTYNHDKERTKAILESKSFSSKIGTDLRCRFIGFMDPFQSSRFSKLVDVVVKDFVAYTHTSEGERWFHILGQVSYAFYMNLPFCNGLVFSNKTRLW